MNGKQLGLLFALLVLLGGAGLLVQRNRNQALATATAGAGGKLLGDNFPINDVAAITIKHGTNELNLVKQDDLWRVRERNNYPAAFPQISDFLVKARDLKIVEGDEVSPDDLAGLQLAPGQGANSGTGLYLKDKDGKLIKTLTLGKTHARKPAQKSPSGEDEGFPDGRYVMLAGDSHDVLLVGDALSEIDAKPEMWLNKDFFKIERPKAVSVSYPDATNSWKIARDDESGAWKFLNPEPGESPDTNKLAGVSAPFGAPSFEDVLTGAMTNDTGLDKPTVVTVDTFDDLTYQVKVGKKTGENFPLTMTVTANFPKERTAVPGEKPDEKAGADKAWQTRQMELDAKFKQAKAYENWIYSVPGWNLDAFLKDRKDLMVDKKDESKPTDSSAMPEDKKDEAQPVPAEMPK